MHHTQVLPEQLTRAFQVEEVQALMGYASKSMIEHYLDGHDAPWTEVAPALTLGK